MGFISNLRASSLAPKESWSSVQGRGSLLGRGLFPILPPRCRFPGLHTPSAVPPATLLRETPRGVGNERVHTPDPHLWEVDTAELALGFGGVTLGLWLSLSGRPPHLRIGLLTLSSPDPGGERNAGSALGSAGRGQAQVPCLDPRSRPAEVQVLVSSPNPCGGPHVPLPCLDSSSLPPKAKGQTRSPVKGPHFDFPTPHTFAHMVPSTQSALMRKLQLGHTQRVCLGLPRLPSNRAASL